MAKCGFCGSTIFMGGVRAGATRFCNNKCCQDSKALGFSSIIPADVLERRLEEVWRGNCPKCRGLGPIDVHRIHEVWSDLVLTRWSTKAQLSCRSCATKRQLGGLGFSLLFGWWGFPWGLVLTPVQITRNVKGIFRGPDSSGPSAELRKMVLINLGAKTVASRNAAAIKQPPPLPGS
jgi:hypothetical protein